MYLDHFHLKEFPFSLTPDTQFYFAKKSKQDGMDFLKACLANGEGFVKIIGEIGTGKTVLCRRLVNAISDQYVTAYIPNPYITPTELKTMLAYELGIEVDSSISENVLLSKIYAKLVDLANSNRRLVVVIDEAQAMPRETLESVRLISNFETEKQKLLTIVLVGQPELDELLAKEELRQLRQRIVFSYRMDTVRKIDIPRYVYFRMEQAGYRNRNPFTRGALKLLYYATGGVPRLLNILCHKSLLLAYGNGVRYVDVGLMWRAILDSSEAFTMGSQIGFLRRFKWPLVAGVSVVSAVGIQLFWQVL